MDKAASLGIIDWGIGGIGIYKRIRQRSGLPIVYLSDTGATPYGKMSRSELSGRLDAVIAYLASCGAASILIGCNAASTAINDLKQRNLPVRGVIDPAVEMAEREQPTSLGLIGGRRTVVSGVYRKAFAARGIDVRQRIAQPLSALIESGDTSSGLLIRTAESILAPLKDCSHILLACTHYPAISRVIAEIVSPTTRLLDPAEYIARSVPMDKAGTGRDVFLTTGDPDAMRVAAANAFDVKVTAIQKVSI